mmetsp:Transcript_28891/g.97413  ORF Transcript_28891/g.97413 Transcript_28891/m.97413 type:complete len:289 (-) Transcript_28891:1143-2009(-)
MRLARLRRRLVSRAAELQRLGQRAELAPQQRRQLGWVARLKVVGVHVAFKRVFNRPASRLSQSPLQPAQPLLQAANGQLVLHARGFHLCEGSPLHRRAAGEVVVVKSLLGEESFIFFRARTQPRREVPHLLQLLLRQADEAHALVGDVHGRVSQPLQQPQAFFLQIVELLLDLLVRRLQLRHAAQRVASQLDAVEHEILVRASLALHRQRLLVGVRRQRRQRVAGAVEYELETSNGGVQKFRSFDLDGEAVGPLFDLPLPIPEQHLHPLVPANGFRDAHAAALGGHGQ